MLSCLFISHAEIQALADCRFRIEFQITARSVLVTWLRTEPWGKVERSRIPLQMKPGGHVVLPATKLSIWPKLSIWA